jgi:hypothetical protein
MFALAHRRIYTLMANLFQILNKFLMLFYKNGIEESFMNWRVLPPVKIKRTYFRYTCMYMPYFTLGAFGFLITFFFFVLYLFLNPSYLPSVFIQYFSPFFSLPSLSFRYISLSLLIAHPPPSFLSFHPIPVFSLLFFTPEYFGISCHTPCCIWIL